MKRILRQICMLSTILVIGAFVASAYAQSYAIDWSTVDGGGGTSTAGAFELSGTIGQPDAGPSTGAIIGGTYEVVGGFWPMTATCTCPGDLNGDTQKNGRDIQQFVQCAIAGGACTCAEMDGNPGVSLGDAAVFVADLLANAPCP